MRNTATAIITVTALACLTLAACDEARERPATKVRAAAAGDNACSGAQPVAPQGWCDLHKVSASKCARCNPAIAAAFKARGDWCDEHELPGSQCLICNPAQKEGPTPSGGACRP